MCKKAFFWIESSFRIYWKHPETLRQHGVNELAQVLKRRYLGFELGSLDQESLALNHLATSLQDKKLENYVGVELQLKGDGNRRALGGGWTV